MSLTRKRIVGRKWLPPPNPFWPTLILWLVLDRTQAWGWVWGVVGTITLLWWIGWIGLCWAGRETEPSWATEDPLGPPSRGGGPGQRQ